ncbi:MAG: nuclear transport factor 2 family protein [Lysobacterales bacterium]|jgi:hypothetical protein
MNAAFRIVIVLVCLCAFPVAMADTESDITAALDYYAEMWNEGDVEALHGYYNPDFVLVTSAGTIPLPQRLDDIKALGGSGKDRGELSYYGVTVRPLGDGHAVAWGRARLKFGDGSSIDNQFSTVYVKTPFGWKALLTHQ